MVSHKATYEVAYRLSRPSIYTTSAISVSGKTSMFLESQSNVSISRIPCLCHVVVMMDHAIILSKAIFPQAQIVQFYSLWAGHVRSLQQREVRNRDADSI